MDKELASFDGGALSSLTGVAVSSQTGGDPDISHESLLGLISGVSSPMKPAVVGTMEVDADMSMVAVAIGIIGVVPTGRLKLA